MAGSNLTSGNRIPIRVAVFTLVCVLGLLDSPIQAAGLRFLGRLQAAANILFSDYSD